MELVPDTSRPLADSPGMGHNRWHWDIPPAARCLPGDEVVFATWDASDGQVGRATTAAEVAVQDSSRVHPLTGPVWVEGAEPGDLLAVEVLEVAPDDHGFTLQRPGLGLMREAWTEPFVAHWEIADGFATSAEIPGVRIKGEPFLGVIGVAPSAGLVADVRTREGAAVDPGGNEDRRSVVPDRPNVVAEGLRTGPPRENGGNLDARRLTAGATLYLPVWQEGALLSVGDAHFAQGDGEVCGTAVEMRSRSRLRVGLRRGAVDLASSPNPWFEHVPAASAEVHPVITTVGFAPAGGRDRLRSAAISAVEQLVARLVAERDLSREAAYALCSVAADLAVVQVVNEPTISITASLSLGVFTDSPPT